MTLRYSRHARNQMRLWKISEAEIMEVLDKAEPRPDLKSRGQSGLFAALPVGGRIIKIAFAREESVVFVKTVFPLRKGWEGG